MQQCRRQAQDIWQVTRKSIWTRDQGRCQGPYCQQHPPYSLLPKKAHIDHVIELSQSGTNADSNLRTLCRRCHCLRASLAHQGMIAKALADGVIPPDWRSLVWED